MTDPKTPAPNSQHPQAKALGKNKFNQQKKSPAPEKGGKDTATAPSATPHSPTVAVASASRAPALTAPVAPSPAVSTPKLPSPGKDLNRFEITVKLNGSDEPAFAVDVPLTGNGAADQAAARALAKKKHPGKQMTVVGSRIFTRTENATEILPGSTLSALFGASGEVTQDLIEIGKAFYDGSRGTIFLRNLRTHVGLTFRPATGGLAVFSNRIVSNRLASELPLIVAEILGNNAREIEIYLK